MSSDSNKSYPKKLYYKINEVASIVGVEDYVLRYWETRFPMLRPEKQRGDQRRYRQKDIELLLKIQQLVHTDSYSIQDAVEILKSKDKRRKASPPKQVSAKKEPSVSRATTPANGNSAANSHASVNGASHAQNGSSSNGSYGGNQKAPVMQAQLFDETKQQEVHEVEESKDERHKDSLRDELLALKAELEAMREEIN